MSILNAHIRRDRALIAVDTLCKLKTPLSDEPIFLEVSKAVPFVHANAVLAGRGDHTVLLEVAQRMNLTLSDMQIEDMADSLHHLANSLQPRPVFSPTELLVVGWSRREKRILAARCEQTVEGTAFRVTSREEWDELGPDMGLTAMPAISTLSEMGMLARRQVAWHRERLPDEVIGGRLVLIEVGNSTMTMRDGGSL